MSRNLRSLVIAIGTSTFLFSCSFVKDEERATKPATAAGRSGGGSGGKGSGTLKSGGAGGKSASAAKDGSGGAGGKSASVAKASSGGAGGSKNSAATSKEDDAPTTRVAIETFETPADFGDWTADNSKAHDGEMSLHPPPLDPKTSATYEYACEGKESNQVSFWLNIESVLDGQQLDLKVDGKLYEWFSETFYSAWKPQVLNLKRGAHRFTWIASTTNSGEPAFWIDTIDCSNNPESENTSGVFGFQEGFVPPEVTGTFVVDNWGPDTSHPTNLTAHPPIVSPSDKPAYMEFSCGGKPHSKLSFQYATRELSTGWRLKFFVNDQLKETFDETYGSWDPRVVLNADPSKAPTYKWVAEADVKGRPEVWIDDIKCE